MDLLTTLELSKLSGVSVDELRTMHRKKKFEELTIQFVPKGAILWDKKILQKLKNDWERTSRRTCQHSQPLEWGSSQSRHSGKEDFCWHGNEGNSGRAEVGDCAIAEDGTQSYSQNCHCWLSQSLDSWRVHAFGRSEASGSLNSLHGENKRCFSYRLRGLPSSLSNVSPLKNMELKDDNSTYHSGSFLQSRIKKQIKDYHSPHCTSLEEALVAHPFILYQSQICEHSKTSEKKPEGMNDIFGRWFVRLKGASERSVSYMNVQGAES